VPQLVALHALRRGARAAAGCGGDGKHRLGVGLGVLGAWEAAAGGGDERGRRGGCGSDQHLAARHALAARGRRRLLLLLPLLLLKLLCGEGKSPLRRPLLLLWLLLLLLLLLLLRQLLLLLNMLLLVPCMVPPFADAEPCQWRATGTVVAKETTGPPLLLYSQAAEQLLRMLHQHLLRVPHV
jgi:hypothetical protein